MAELVEMYLAALTTRDDLLKKNDTSNTLLQEAEDYLDDHWEKITGVKVIW